MKVVKQQVFISRETSVPTTSTAPLMRIAHIIGGRRLLCCSFRYSKTVRLQHADLLGDVGMGPPVIDLLAVVCHPIHIGASAI
jgi:hypothetical protein